MPSESRVPIVETTIAAPPETVWRALRDPTLIARWHGWEYEGLASEIEEIYGRARAYEAERRLVIGGLDHWFELEPIEDGTRLRVTKPAPEEAPDDPDGYDEIGEGWTTFVHQLRYFLERHPGEDRATVMLRAGGGAPLTPAEVGLEGDGAAGLPELFRTRHQTGLLVGDDALLVLVAHPGGGGRLILSAYGADRTMLEQMGSRWAAALGERYGDVTDA